MNDLLISDLHLSSTPRDSYRFAVFDKVKEYSDTPRREPIERIWILGDLTDAKDYHSGLLVNLICAHVADLAKLAEVHIVRGNHDGIDPEWPFFNFLHLIPDVFYYAKPTYAGRNTFVLPHSRNPNKDWNGIDVWLAKTKIDQVMMHMTFKGAISESGVLISDLEVPAQLRRKGWNIYSGDVHVPQQVGNVTYVGSPHHVHYGDKFQPRMLHITVKGDLSIPLVGIKRMMLDVESAAALKDLEGAVTKGDQAKVRLHLDESRLGEWQQERHKVMAICDKLGLDVAAVELIRTKSSRPLLAHNKTQRRTPQEIMAQYVAAHDIAPSSAAVAEMLLNKATKRVQ